VSHGFSCGQLTEMVQTRQLKAEGGWGVFLKILEVISYKGSGRDRMILGVKEDMEG